MSFLSSYQVVIKSYQFGTFSDLNVLIYNILSPDLILFHCRKSDGFTSHLKRHGACPPSSIDTTRSRMPLNRSSFSRYATVNEHRCGKSRSASNPRRIYKWYVFHIYMFNSVQLLEGILQSSWTMNICPLRSFELMALGEFLWLTKLEIWGSYTAQSQQTVLLRILPIDLIELPRPCIPFLALHDICIMIQYYNVLFKSMVIQTHIMIEFASLLRCWAHFSVLAGKDCDACALAIRICPKQQCT